MEKIKININKESLREVKGGAELYGAILELSSAKILLENHVHDLTLEIKSTKASLRSVKKRLEKGHVIFKEIRGKMAESLLQKIPK